jgi:hypothetical protein
MLGSNDRFKLQDAPVSFPDHALQLSDELLLPLSMKHGTHPVADPPLLLFSFLTVGINIHSK